MGAQLLISTNPFTRGKDTRCAAVTEGLTLREALAQSRPELREFALPTVCMVNGRAKMREEWDTYRIQKDDVVAFVSYPGFTVPLWVLWAFVIVSVAVSVYALLTIPKPGLPGGDGSTPQPDPVYDFKGQRNQLRLGHPIEVPYGRNRLWPSYAARPYNKYVNNDQYHYGLYCLGQGSYDIETIQIEDTAIGNFQDVDYEICPPGTPVTLFPDNVITSVEVGGIELLGPNEVGYAGESGPFVANSAGSQSNHLEVDVVLPQGLYLAQNDGTLGNLTVTGLFEYRLIDDAGAPLGAWTTLATFTKTLKTNTPQRFTLEADVTAGRYEVRGVRTNDKNTDSKAANMLQWVALRAFLPSTKDFGNVTMFAFKAKATNNLNDNAANRLNLIGTRKLRIWNGATWSAETATRSLVWAFCDNFQADYAGQLDDEFLFLDDLLALDVIYTAAGKTFDFVFDQRSTVWDQAKLIARAGRAVPMLNGSRVTMVRDYAKTLPTAIFNQECIIEGSFRWDIALAGLDEYDGVKIEYIDPATWKPEFVTCLVGDDTGDNCEQVKLPGVNSRTNAYREGMYYRAVRKYLRENITFRTGMEGHLPTYGDLVGVAHDLPRWSQGGLVLSVSGTTLQLSEPVTFGVGAHVIGFRKKDGTLSGPHTVTAGSVSTEVIVTAFVESEFFFDDVNEPPMFLFGTSAEWAKLCTVTGLAPSDDDTVEVSCVPYDSRIFDADAATPDPLVSGSSPERAPDLPIVANVLVRPNPNTTQTALVSWDMALGAKSYVVQLSYDDVNWETVATPRNNYAEISALAGQIYVRVAGLNVGAGDWATWDGVLEPVEPGQAYPDAVYGGTDYNELN